jgi:hypothetical protein
MDTPTYSFRLSQFRKEAAYRLTDQGLAWSEPGRDGTLSFADIRQIRVYDTPSVNDIPAFTRCTIRRNAGRAVILSSNHFVSLVDWQSRTKSFRPFVDALLHRAALANPGIVFISGMPAALWALWVAVLFSLPAFALLGIVAIATQGKDMSAGTLGMLVACFGLLLAFYPLLRLVRRNRPHRFDGREGYPAE